MTLVVEDIVADRTGQYEHPVWISTLGNRGHLVEIKVCTLCADDGNYITRRAAVAVPGETCPVCAASLCPA